MSGAPERILTSIYTVNRQAFVKIALRRQAERTWWLTVTPVVALAVAGVAVDAAYALVALMVVMLVYPTLLMMAYFNEVLRPEALQCCHRQRAEIAWPEITVMYYDDDDKATGSRRADLSDSRHVVMTREYFVAEVARHDYIVVPARAMSDAEWMELAERVTDARL